MTTPEWICVLLRKSRKSTATAAFDLTSLGKGRILVSGLVA